MFGYAINGLSIVATKEECPGSASIQSGSIVFKDDEIEFQYEGSTIFDYDAQQTVTQGGETIFLDADSNEWPGCSIILLPSPLDIIDDEGDENFGEVEALPADQLAAATAAYEEWVAEMEGVSEVSYSIAAPKGGFRAANSFTDEEKKRLRPVAEVLAMMDGNAFFGATTDDNGDDTFYEQYLPEAAALADANGGWFNMASFVRGDTPLPGSIFAGMIADEPQILRLCEIGQSVRISVSGIEWDVTDEQDQAGDLALPADLLADVPTDWQEDGRLADLLSDHFGFCVLGYAEARQVLLA
jgi:hypothetical protein